MRPNFFTAWPAASCASASLVTSSRVASSRSWVPRRAATVLGSRAVATTASPAFNAASAIRAPNPREAPVMNQTRMMLPFPLVPSGLAGLMAKE
jgi:hypothetical protein